MKTKSNILTECNVDTLIAKTILYPDKNYIHKKGCNQVLNQIDLSAFNLPSDLEGMKKRTKQANSLLDSDLKRLFLTLKQHENSDFYKLAQWIELFRTNPYNLIMEIL